MSVRQPVLKADSVKVLELYLNNDAVTAKDIQNCFGISESTAFTVVKYVYEYATKHGIKIYTPPTRKLVPTDLLFEAYGWDVQKLQAKVKILQKLDGLKI